MISVETQWAISLSGEAILNILKDIESFIHVLLKM
jgi:hypothetical protein